jgi:hypothetical protein
MSELIRQDITSLLDSWIEAEKNGIQFPVPLHDHWNVAGHSTKQDAFRLLESRQEERFDYLGTTLKNNPGRGRKAKAMFLTVAALERFCLAAHTPQGDAIRELYRQSKAKWDLVKQVAPQVAEEVEVLAMKIELAKIEAQKAALEDKTLSLRHYVVTALPKPTAYRILGITEVKEIEYRDRVIKDNQIINGGGTVNKGEICRHFSILTKNGKPDYPRLNTILARLDLPAAAWEETDVVQTNRELRREYLEVLSRALYTAEQRQIFLGE